MRALGYWLVLISVGVLVNPAGAGPIVAPATLSRTTFEARGVHDAVLTVADYGRYALRAASDQGTQLQLIDRIVGPRGESGAAGEKDGRIDAFFDAGEYKVVATSAEKGKGALALSVQPFVEQNLPEPPVLVENVAVHATLADLQKVSYWLEVPTRRTVYLEAQGRDLADLRLWHEGNWLVAAEPAAREAGQGEGRPEGNLQLVASLNPGWYLVTAYGGASRPWARSPSEHRFHLRLGVPALPVVARLDAQVSAFGVDRYLVPQDADRFSVELAQSKDLRLEVKDFEPGSAFEPANDSAVITPKNQEPIAVVRHHGSKKFSLVSVCGTAGQAYTLQVFETATLPFRITKQSGDRWIASVSAGSRADRIDVTGILTVRARGDLHEKVHAADVIHVGFAKQWARRFNLLARETLFLYVEDAGDYTVHATGTPARFRFEPFQVSAPKDYQVPALKAAGEKWALDRGYWVLTLDPDVKGIITAAVGRADSLLAVPDTRDPAHTSCLLPPVHLDPESSYALHLNERAWDESGLVMRPRLPGQETFPELAPAPVPEAAPRYLPPKIAESFAHFPVLAEGAPLYFDIERNDEKTATFRVDAPASYRIETTGLLQTACTVRTRTAPKLFSDEAGGDGRNSRLMPYLKPGEYQVTVRTMGESRGHAGLTLAHTPVVDGGALVPGREMRERVAPGAAIQYALTIPRTAQYHVATLGTGKAFGCRLEDAAGWPLVPTGADADLTCSMAAGAYRYMTLPRDTESLRVSLVEPVAPIRAVEGRGPHAIQLDESVENLWREPAVGQPAAQDLYDVTVPATVDATIGLSEEHMQAHLKRQSAPADPPVAVVHPGKVWSGELARGAYRLEVECSRPDDAVRYTVSVNAKQLVAGSSRDVEVPTTLGVRVDHASVVELASHGKLDVRAKLFRDDTGEQVDANDDAESDWNFRIARQLAPGAYTLKVEAVGAESGSTHLTMQVPDESAAPAVRAPFDAQLALAGKIQVVPLETPPDGVLSIRVSATGLVGCVLESVADGGARVLAQRAGHACAIDLAVDPAAHYRLRIWSVDHQSDAVRLVVARTTPERRTAEALNVPGPLEATAIAGERSLFAAVTVERPGTFRPHPTGGFAASTAIGTALAEPGAEVLALPAGPAMLAWRGVEPGASTVQLERVALESKHGLTIPVAPTAPRWLDVACGPGDFPVLIADADAGGPACAFAPTPTEDPILARTYERTERQCVAVGAPGSARAEVWCSDAATAPDCQMKLRLETVPVAGAETPLPSGHTARKLAARAQARYALAPGAKQVDVALERGLIAFTWDGTAVGDVVTALTGARSARLDTTAMHLVIVDLAGAGGQAGVDLFGAAAAVALPVLGLEALHEQVLAAPATLRLDLDPRLIAHPGATLHVEGTAVTCAYTDRSGLVHAERTVRLVGAPGFATLTAGPGLIKAWVADDAHDLATRWGSVKIPAGDPVEADSAVLLSGPVRAFTVEVRAPRSVHFETDHPATACLIGADGRFLAVNEGLTGCSFDHYVAAGRYTLAVRGLEGAVLSGQARVGFSEVPALHDGPGPECLLASGQSRTFSFVVPGPRTIGIGIKTTRDLVQCDLLTLDGKLVRRGRHLLTALDAGTYLVRVSVPSAVEPVRCQPVIFGLEPPGLGPPEDAVREFLNTTGVDGEGN